MTGSLIVIILAALLIAGLAPAHHRSRAPFVPGVDRRHDRDHQRLTAELDAAAQRQVRGPRRVVRLLGAAGSAVPFHRAAPRVTTR